MTFRAPACCALVFGLCECGGDDGSTADEAAVLAESEAYWQPAEGKWITAEQAYSGDCNAAISDLNFLAEDADELRCLSLEFDQYRGTPLMAGLDCENGMDKVPASFELDADGRMLDRPLEYFVDGTSEYPCDWSRSQFELILFEGQPYIVFWIEDASVEGALECPEELPEDAEVTCIKSVYRLAPLEE